MVQEKKKKNTTGGKSLKIKASVGAWWKSTSTDTVEETTGQPEASPAEKKGAEKTTDTPVKNKPGKRASRKKKEDAVIVPDRDMTGPVAEVPAKEEQAASGDKGKKTGSGAKGKSTAAGRGRGRRKTAEKKNPDAAKIAINDSGETAVPPVEEGEEMAAESGVRDDSASTAADEAGTEDTAQHEAGQNEELEVQGKAAADGKERKRSREKSGEELPEAPGMTKPETRPVTKLLINAEEPEECRLALLEDGRLESIHVSTVSQTQRKNNIYKARIVALEPSLQAAFVDYGAEKNGFLPFGEIHPEYYRQELSGELEELAATHQWKKLSITDVLEKGQEVLAQVVKEEVGKKGANMTTFLSIPGRCVVLMPGSDSAGISRKISGEQRRSQLREVMKGFAIPEGIGWIVRTASVDITEDALSRDVDYLLKLWADIKEKGQKIEGVGKVYEDQQSILRFLREHFDPAIQEILVDNDTALEEVRSFIRLQPKAQQDVKVRLHQGARPIFNQYSVEDQIESIYQPQVSLPSGGSIVIDPTEALVAIDVNSGSTSRGKNFENSIFQANMEAATELARQLRLRDLGGVIVVDFIDMRSRKHIIAVEKQLKAAMKRDKAKVDFTRISKFGLMQISRQKLGAPIEAGNYRRCEYCKGRGIVRSVETQSLFYLRRIQTGASRKPVERIECHFPLDVAAYLLNQKRTEITDLEKRYEVEVTIHASSGMKPGDHDIIFHKVEKEPKKRK